MTAQLIPLDSVRVHGNYRALSSEDVSRLADDMRANGYRAAYPLEIDAAGYIIAGHHRHAAAVAAGLPTVWAVIREDVQAGTSAGLLAQLRENLSRHQSDALEDGRAFSRLVESGEAVEDVARAIGRTAGYVRDRVTLASLDPVAQSLGMSRGIRWALTLADLPTHLQAELARDIPRGATLETFAEAVGKAREAWQESLQAGLFGGMDLELAAQEWDTDLGAYVTDAMREAETRKAEEEAARIVTVRDEPLGRQELAAALRVSVAAVDKRLQRGTLVPDLTVSGSPIWYASTVAGML
jgi:ParB-like chromosome segregation protein Spo0J